MTTLNPTTHQPDDRSGVLVVGLGRFGEALCRGLVDQGIDVLAVDFDEEIVQRLAGDIPNVVQADATSARALRQIGADNFTRAVVAIATNIEASVMATLALIDETATQCLAETSETDHQHTTAIIWSCCRRVQRRHGCSPQGIGRFTRYEADSLIRSAAGRSDNGRDSADSATRSPWPE